MATSSPRWAVLECTLRSTVGKGAKLTRVQHAAAAAAAADRGVEGSGLTEKLNLGGC